MMKNRKYPNHLYPKKIYKKIIFDSKLNDHCLLRYTSSDKPIEKGKLGEHMGASQFSGGCSVNLLSVYRKCDSRYAVNGKSDAPQHQYWNEEDSSYVLHSKDFKYDKKREFIGVKIKDVRSTYIDNRSIIVNGTKIRDDKVFFDIEHAPTRCNFWHYNMYIYGINSQTKERYCLSTLNNYSNGQLKKVAVDLLHKLETHLLLPSQMKSHYLPKRYYMSN